MKALTTRQESILRFVLEYRAEHDCSPTIREIGQAFGIKPGAAHAHMKALVKKGVLVQITSATGRNKGWRRPE